MQPTPPPNFRPEPPMFGVPYPPASAHASPPRAARLPLVLSMLAVLLAVGALVVSLVREPKLDASASASAPPIPAVQPTAVPSEVFNDAADKPLCEAIEPLMRELVTQNKAYAVFVPGSPEQGNAIPGYRAFIEKWAQDTQAAINKFASPPRLLTRTLQAYVDDKLLYTELVTPGRIDTYDEAT